MSRLATIQKALRVGKEATNDFGGYNYRTVDLILSRLRPLLQDDEPILLSDGLCELAGQVFVEATVTLTLSDGVHTAKGYALHPMTKKGMDPSQITGSASTYARKYALSGLLALDDGKDDPDAATRDYEPETPEAVLGAVTNADSLQVLQSVWSANKEYQGNSDFQKAKDARKAQLQNGAAH